MTTALYLRMSQDRSGEELGIDRYRDDCHRTCTRYALTNPIEYVDNDVSAATARKADSAYTRLIADVKAGRITVVVTPDLDRLTRTPREIEDWIDLVDNHGVRLITADGEVDAATENGQMFMRIKAAVARHEIARKGRRHRKEMKQRAERGLFHGGPRPFGYGPIVGYQTVTDPKTGEQVNKPIRDYDQLVDGEADHIRAWVAHIIDMKSITSLSRKTGRPIPVLRRILLNPRNAGLRILHDVEYKGLWAAIISVDEWRQVAAILNNPDRARDPNHTARKWLGAGVYLCDRCDRPVKSATNSAGVGRGYYPVYRCIPGKGGCGRSWKATPLDDYITGLIAARFAEKDADDLLPVHGPDMQALVRERADLRRRQRTLAGQYMSMGMSDQDFQDATMHARERLAEIERLVSADSTDEVLRAVLRHDDPVAAWLALDSVATRQSVVRSLMRVRLGAPPRGRAGFRPSVFDASSWVGEERTWGEIWAAL